MSRIARRVVMSAVLLVPAATATAQDEAGAVARSQAARDRAAEKCAALLHDGLEALSAHRLEDAERWLDQGLAEARKLGPDSLEMAAALEGQSALAGVRKKQSEAESYLARAVAIREKAFGSDDPALAQTLQNLAALKAATDKNAEAESIARRALAIREKHPGADGIDLADALDLLALIEVYQDHPRKADEAFRRALAIRRKALGPDHPDVAQALIKMAEAHVGRAVSARVGALLEGVKDLGAGLPRTRHLDGYRAAEALLEEALAIRQKTLGPGHPDTVDTLEMLANVYNGNDDHARADTLRLRLLAIREKTLGPDHPEVADTLEDLAIRATEQGKYRQAESLLKRALTIREKQAQAKPDDREVRHAEEECARSLRSAARSAEVMEDPRLRPTDDDLKYLNRLEYSVKEPNLTRLFNTEDIQLLDDSVVDADLIHLRGLVNAVRLNISGTARITDAGLVHLQHLTNLKHLHLTGASIRGPGLVHLKGMTELEWLSLGACRSLDDSGLANLPLLPRLKRLDLAYTDVSDAGLAQLARFPALRTVSVAEGKITAAGIEKLQRARPGLKVEPLQGGFGRRALTKPAAPEAPALVEPVKPVPPPGRSGP